jgi:hypothetical protein
VLAHLKTAKKYVCLIAQTQSGKTGTTRYIFREYLKLNPSKKLLFICPLNDLSLKDQQIREFDEFEGITILFLKDMEKILRNRKHDVQMNYDNTLIAVDESHISQNACSVVHKFLTQIVGITPDGITKKWKAKDTKIISISATPMSEQAHFLSELSSPEFKAKVVLKPGMNYYSVLDMQDADKLHQSYHYKNDLERGILVDIIHQHYYNFEHGSMGGYIIIRTNNRSIAREQLTSDLKTKVGESNIKFVDHHSKNGRLQGINEIIQCKPEHFTILYVYNSLRAGYQLDTRYVAMVHETPDANVDVTAQGLLGRCTGYNKRAYGVHVYCNMESANLYIEYIGSNFDPQQIPDKSRNIQAGTTTNSAPKTRIKFYRNMIPILKPLPKQILEKLEMLLLNSKPKMSMSAIYKKINQIPNMKNKIRNLFPTIRWEDYHVAGKGQGMMILTDQNAKKSLSFFDNGLSKALTKQPYSGFTNVNLDPDENQYYFLYINLRKRDAYYGYVLFTHKERIPAEEIQTPRTTGKEHFHPYNNDDLQSKTSQPKSLIQLKTSQPKTLIQLKTSGKSDEKIQLKLKT